MCIGARGVASMSSWKIYDDSGGMFLVVYAHTRSFRVVGLLAVTSFLLFAAVETLLTRILYVAPQFFTFLHAESCAYTFCHSLSLDCLSYPLDINQNHSNIANIYRCSDV